MKMPNLSLFLHPKHPQERGTAGNLVEITRMRGRIFRRAVDCTEVHLPVIRRVWSVLSSGME